MRQKNFTIVAVSGHFDPCHYEGDYIIQTCKYCGREQRLERRKYRAKRRNSGCCRSCFMKYEIDRKGEKNPNWKGGKHVGYIRITLQPDHPFYCMVDSHKRVKEHRLVLAQHLGRVLRDDEFVHHKNGIKNDNRPENLEILPPKQHNPYLHLRRRIADLEKRVTLLEAENIALKEVMYEKSA